MKKTFFALTATLALAAAAPALAKSEVRSFTHEGVTYNYTVSTAGKSTIYQGYVNSGARFRFVKHGDQITGTANGIPVSFRMDEVAKVATTITLASR